MMAMGRKRILALGALLTLLFVSGCRSVESRKATPRRFRVLSVIDGETFTVRYGGKKAPVGLAGFVAPELEEPGGDQAREALAILIEGRTVRIAFAHGGRRDRFGRLLGYVRVGKLNAAEEMARQGHSAKR